MLKKQIFIIFFLALFLRLFYIAIVPARSMDLDDSGKWNSVALHFLEGQGFLTHTEELDPRRPPLYSLFMAFNYLLFGKENFIAVKISQCILNSLTCVICFFIAHHLFGASKAFFMGILLSVYPPFIVYSEILMSEILYICLLSLFIFSWCLSAKSSRWHAFCLMGLFLGLLNLCRGNLLFFPFWIILSVLIIKENRVYFIKYLTAILISFILVLPWTWRNFKVFHAFIPIVPASESFWFGTIPLQSQLKSGLAPELQELHLTNDVVKNEKIFKEEALKNIVKSPVSYFRLTIKKFIYFWYKPVGHVLISKISPLLGGLLFFSHLGLLVLFLIGFIFTSSEWRVLIPLYLIIGYFTALHTFLNPQPRYRLPIEPFIVMFAVMGISQLRKRLSA